MTEKEAYELIEREEAAASLMEDKYNALCAAHDSYCDGDGDQFMTRDEILIELIPARDDWDRISDDQYSPRKSTATRCLRRHGGIS